MIEVIQTRIVTDKEGEHLEYLTSDGKRYRHANYVKDIDDDRNRPAGMVSQKKILDN